MGEGRRDASCVRRGMQLQDADAAVVAPASAASCKTLWTSRIFDDQFRLFEERDGNDEREREANVINKRWRMRILIIIRKIGHSGVLKNH